MTEFANLELRVGSTTVDKATASLNKMAASGDKAGASADKLSQLTRDAQGRWRNASGEIASFSDKIAGLSVHQKIAAVDMRDMAAKGASSFEGLGKAARGLALPLIGVGTAVAAAHKVIAETTAYEDLLARLEGVTSGAEGASAAFNHLEEMSDSTRFSENELAEAFIHLQQAGLDTSDRSMRAFIDMAAATRTSMEGMADVVLQASLGVTRGLKAFGISAKAENDKLVVTYRGATKEIANDATSIQRYLVGIGEAHFDGAAARQLDTMGGSVKKLDDAWGDMFREIGRSSVGDAIKHSIGAAADVLNGITSAITEVAYILSVHEAPAMSDARKKALNSWIAGAASYGAALTDAEQSFDDSVASAVKEIEKGAISGADKDLQEYSKKRALLLDALNKGSKAVDPGIIDQLDQQYADKVNGAGKTKDNAGKERAAKLAALRIELQESTDAATTAYDKREREITAITAKGSKLRLELQTQNNALAANALLESLQSEEAKIEASHLQRQQLIEKISVGGTEKRAALVAASQIQYDRERASLKESKEQEYNTIVESLLSEEDAIRLSYDRRRAVLDKDTTHPETYQKAVSDLDAQLAKDLAVKDNARKSEFAALDDYYATEHEKLLRAQEARRNAILTNEQITQEQKHALLAKESEKALEEQAAYETAQVQLTVTNAAGLFGALADLAKDYGGEQSEVYQALFAANKAFAIADAGISIATGAAAAWKLGWPAGIPAALAVAANGAKLMSTITNTNYTGAYDGGGHIPAGGFGIAGEYGPEVIRGPATVTSRRDTKAILDRASGTQAPIVLRIVNAPDQAAAHQYAQSVPGERTQMNVIKRNATAIRSIVLGR